MANQPGRNVVGDVERDGHLHPAPVDCVHLVVHPEDLTSRGGGMSRPLPGGTVGAGGGGFPGGQHGLDGGHFPGGSSATHPVVRNLPSQRRLGSLLTVGVLLQLILGQNFLPEDENFDPFLYLLLRVSQSHQVSTLILHYKVVTEVRMLADIVRKNVGCDDKINIRPS